MQQRQVNKPLAVNLDKSKKYLKPEEAFYMLNRERNINGVGTYGKTTPLVANYLACLIDQPLGDNYSIGHLYSKLTNELYWWVYNSNGVNYIARLNSDGSCQIVYDGDCLSLSAAPEHSIEEWKCYLKYDRFCAHQHGKQLIWTDGVNPIGMIDVEASIATNSFTTSFFDNCTDDCAPVQMCVPEPCGALVGEFIPLAGDQIDLNNHLIDIGIKVAYFDIYYDQRETVMSDISTLYYQDSKGCFDATEGFPRCLKFTIPLGNPLVDKKEFVFSTDNGITWKSAEIIEKYKPYTNAAQYWYERELADLPDLNLDNCTFSYTFCNDKECNPIDPKRASRVFNPMPRKPQGVLPLTINSKTALGFYNYFKGNCPVDGEQAAKFEVSINNCDFDNCVDEIATVTARVICHSPLLNLNGFIWRLKGNDGDPDDETSADRAIFGASFDPESMGQYFAGTIRNFIPYIDATSNWAQMKQWKSDPFFQNPREVGIISGMDHSEVRQRVFFEVFAGVFYFQELKFKVRKGTKGFIRLASHQSLNGLPSEGQDKSTFVSGTISNLNLYSGNMDIGGIISGNKELYFDTCSGDVEIDETLVVDDNYRVFQTGAHSACAYSGYITDANSQIVSGAEVWYNGTRRAVTDFNGFYHFTLYGDENTQTIVVQIKVETGCVGGFNTVKNVTLDSSYGFMAVVNIQISDTDDPGYKTNFYELVDIPVKDCDSQSVGGVRVSLSGNKYEVSDAVTGVATFKVRNYSSRNRSVRAVIMDSGQCFSLNCADACNPCMPSTNNTLLSACFSGVPYTTIATTTNLNKDISFLHKRGLKAGGRYPFAFVAKGSCGQLSAAYPVTAMNGSLPTGDNYLNIPKTQEKNKLSFCDFSYNATGMILPDWTDCVVLCRGANVNNYELQWVIDKIERTTDSKIKLTIQSLNDYNATYNFQTNTLYQYIKGDRVEFIANGDGVPFDTATYGLLNYQILSPFHDKIISGQTEAPADFFNQLLIQDDGKLDGLTVGAKIELQRPSDCTVEPTYYAIPEAILDVIEISGQKMLAVPSGTFTTFDTFLVTRQIESKVPLSSNPAQQFEHKFPSDFWGQANTEGIFTGLSDIGKTYFINKFENEKRWGRNLTLNSPTKFNYFGDLEKTFDAPEQGDIVAMGLYDGKIGVAIGEIDNFLFQISDDFLRLGAGGVVQAAPADSLISDTQPKIKGVFGCQYSDVGSIYFGDGFITWVDNTSMSYVKHDFNLAKDISEGKFKLWVKKRGQFMANFNRTAPNDVSKYRYFTGFNLHTGALQLTAKALSQSGINNEQEPFIDTKDTILIDPNAEDLLTFASYTPEGYSNVILNTANGACFISFLNGQPYIHPIIPIKYNEFFGTACDSIVGIAINENADKVKVAVAMQIQDEIMWFCSRVKVDTSSFDSEIPPVRYKFVEDKWTASFLFDKNSRGQLYGTDPLIAGTPPRGYFCAVTLVRNNTNNLIYGSIDNAKRTIFDELDLILFKYSISEQSGFTNNL